MQLTTIHLLIIVFLNRCRSRFFCVKLDKCKPAQCAAHIHGPWLLAHWTANVHRTKSLCGILNDRLHYKFTAESQAERISRIDQHRLSCGFMSHTHTHTSVLRPFFRDHPGESVPKENFWTLWCKGRLTEVDTPTIRLGTTPSGLSSAHLHHPHLRPT